MAVCSRCSCPILLHLWLGMASSTGPAACCMVVALQEVKTANRSPGFQAEGANKLVPNEPDHAEGISFKNEALAQAETDPNTHSPATDSSVAHRLQAALASAGAEAHDQRQKHSASLQMQQQTATHAKALAVQVSELQAALAAAHTKAAEEARANRVLVSQYQSEAAAAKREAGALREASASATRTLEERTAAMERLVLERDGAVQHLTAAHADAESLRLLLKDQHAAIEMLTKQVQAKEQGSTGKGRSLPIDAMGPKGVPLLFASGAGGGSSNAGSFLAFEPGRDQQEVDLQARLNDMGKEHQRLLSQLHAAEARAESAAGAARAETQKRRELASEVQKLRSQLDKLEAQAVRWEQECEVG